MFIDSYGLTIVNPKGDSMYRIVFLCVLLTGCASINLAERRVTLMQIDSQTRVTIKKVKGVPSIVYEKKF